MSDVKVFPYLPCHSGVVPMFSFNTITPFDLHMAHLNYFADGKLGILDGLPVVDASCKNFKSKQYLANLLYKLKIH